MSEDRGPGSLPELPAQRVSDDDRDRTITRLRDAAGNGMLDLDELEDRVGAVYLATTAPDLAALTADLPAAQSVAPPPDESKLPALRDDDFVQHLTVYVLVIGMLIGIWALGGMGHFWPFYPAAGWGIGLGSHFVAANRKAARRERSRTRHRDGRSRHVEFATTPRPELPSGSSRRRSFVVAMFVDVVGSTGLNEALGDEGWARVRDDVRSLLHECFEREGGWEVNVAGDGVLARFDQPAGAVCAAIEVQRRLARQRADTGFAPSVRIGIHSGDVVEDGDDLIGSVVNLASRVTAAADPDEIMVTEHVVDHLETSFETQDRGIHSLKGVSRPRHLLTVRW